MMQLRLPFKKIIRGPEGVLKVFEAMGFYGNTSPERRILNVKNLMNAYKIFFSTDGECYSLQVTAKGCTQVEIVDRKKFPTWLWTRGHEVVDFERLRI